MAEGKSKVWWSVDEKNLQMPYIIRRERVEKGLQNPRSSLYYPVGMFLFVLTIGVILGVTLPPSPQLSGPYRYASNIIGYIYFSAWSLSFYPQLLLNWKRKTTQGLSYDFVLYNLLGFTCYSFFNLAFFAMPSIQKSYREAHGGNENKVALNDVFFALHAAAITVLTLAQIHFYDGLNAKPSWVCICLTGLAVAASLLYAVVVLAVGHRASGILTWLGWLYFLSYIKMTITTIKYIPQVILNHTRKSTVGWSMMNISLDFVGGILSLLQLLLDCWNTNDWDGIIGDPVKFGLGFVSIFFDLIFIVQHFVLFPYRTKKGDSEDPLLFDRLQESSYDFGQS